jgi:hypothetical protein
MLLTGTLSAESLITRIALCLVIGIVHVPVTSLLSEEVSCTSRTFEHDESGNEDSFDCIPLAETQGCQFTKYRSLSSDPR